MAGKESKSPDDGWEGIAFFFAVDGEDFGGEGGGRRRTKEEGGGSRVYYLFIVVEYSYGLPKPSFLHRN